MLGIAAANTVAVNPRASPALYAVPMIVGAGAALAAHWHLTPRRPGPLARAGGAFARRANAAAARMAQSFEARGRVKGTRARGPRELTRRSQG
jgi:hypothetical protein